MRRFFKTIGEVFAIMFFRLLPVWAPFAVIFFVWSFLTTLQDMSVPFTLSIVLLYLAVTIIAIIGFLISEI
ncbi:MAG: hypothetical protein PWR08_1640 [Thermoanaerobacterium sp.]|nr:hypothetical protein [Thermoanaerobacterium sp.]